MNNEKNIKKNSQNSKQYSTENGREDQRQPIIGISTNDKQARIRPLTAANLVSGQAVVKDQKKDNTIRSKHGKQVNNYVEQASIRKPKESKLSEDVKKLTIKQKEADKSNPWTYKPNTSKVDHEKISESLQEDFDIFIDDEKEKEWEIAERLLKNHTEATSIFLRRLLEQKLSDISELLNYDAKSTFLKENLECLVQFLIKNPNFYMQQREDGYLYFDGLVRSEIYFYLDAILNRREVEVLQASSVDGKDCKQMQHKIEMCRHKNEEVYDYLVDLLNLILGKTNGEDSKFTVLSQVDNKLSKKIAAPGKKPIK